MYVPVLLRHRLDFHYLLDTNFVGIFCAMGMKMYGVPDYGCLVILFPLALYLLYSQLEEEHGLARHAMAVCDRATKAVLPEEQFEVGV